MSEHTPGPWRIEIEGTNSAHWPHIYAGDYEIAQVSDCIWTRPNGKRRNYSQRELAEANAELIVSAPELKSQHDELVKTLEYILRFYQTPEHANQVVFAPNEYCPLCKGAAALALVKGEKE